MSVALVTGTGSGIGKATALELAWHGYRVFASMLDSQIESSDFLRIAKRDNLKLEVIPLDVTDRVACSQTVKLISDQADGVDILVNIAGIGEGGPLEEVPEEVVRRVFEVNYFGPMRLMRLVLPNMRENESGAIVNVSSIMGRLARPGGSAYAGSKFALEASSEALAQEVKRFNIRVALIEPGVVLTPLHTKKEVKQQPVRSSPYDEFAVRGDRLFTALLENPTMPEAVAEVIRHAIETDHPKLRYLVGEDAKKWYSGRMQLSDEEWIDLGREMDIEEYADFYKTRFGIKI